MVSPPDVVKSNPPPIAQAGRVLPYAIAFAMVPLAVIAGIFGGWTVLLLPLFAWGLITLLDLALGVNTKNEDPETDERDLSRYRLLTMIWVPVQFILLFGLIAYASNTYHLDLIEKLFLFIGIGAMTGLVGATYAQELIHRKNRLERWLGDALLAMVLYGHHRTLHLKVHHKDVATPRDLATARYDEDFYGFFQRALTEGPRRAWETELADLKSAGLPAHSPKNPFWIHGGLALVMVALALTLGGAQALLLFLVQAIVAICHLELMNYVAHYGLTRREIAEGTYEPVQPHHSWNAGHKASNWLLINLSRHSDHHATERRYPLLQLLPEAEAPRLPQGYIATGALALVPKVWRRRMNPRLIDWQRRYYPEAVDGAVADVAGVAVPPVVAEEPAKEPTP